MAEEDFDEFYSIFNFEAVANINKNYPFSLYEVDIYDSEDIPNSKDVELGFENEVVTLYDAKLFQKVKRGYRKRNLNVLKNSENLMFLGAFYDTGYKFKILDEKKENIYIIDAAALSIDDVIEFDENFGRLDDE